MKRYDCLRAIAPHFGDELVVTNLGAACGINTLYWRLFSTPDVKTLDDLKGKKIGLTTMGSQEDAVMRFLLKERGINPDRDVSFLAVGAAPTRLAALSKGVVHASVFIPPQDIAAEKLGPAHRSEPAWPSQPWQLFRQHEKLH
jgi:hypothetical protein